MRIDRHKIDKKFIGELLREREPEFPKRLAAAKKSASRLSYLALEALNLAQFTSVAGDSIENLVRYLQLSLDAHAAIFAIANARGKPVVAKLGAEEVAYAEEIDESEIHASKWVRGYLLALICRSQSTLDTLCATATERLRQSSTKVPEYRYHLVDAFRGFMAEDAQAGKYLLKSLQLTDPERQDVPRDWALHIDVPLIHLFKLASSDDDRFGGIAEDAVAKHKQFYSAKRKLRDDPDGFLSLEIIAMASLAHDRGLKVELDSPYVPMGLVNGMYLEMARAKIRDSRND